MVRKGISIFAGLGLALAPIPALADGTQVAAPPVTNKTGPLAPAGAAGVTAAQAYTDIPWVFVVGLSLVGVAVALALTSNQNNGSTTSTTGT